MNLSAGAAILGRRSADGTTRRSGVGRRTFFIISIFDAAAHCGLEIRIVGRAFIYIGAAETTKGRSAARRSLCMPIAQLCLASFAFSTIALEGLAR